MKPSLLQTSLAILALALLTQLISACVETASQCGDASSFQECCDTATDSTIVCRAESSAVSYFTCQTCAAEGEYCIHQSDCCDSCCDGSVCTTDRNACSISTSFLDAIKFAVVFILMIGSILLVCLCCVWIITAPMNKGTNKDKVESDKIRDAKDEEVTLVVLNDSE